MGGKQPKPQPKMDIMDAILELKMSAKQFNMQSKRAKKEQKKHMKSAKAALKKGNEEGARLYLGLAANKAKECMQMLKMGARMDVMATQIQANASNEQLVNKIQGLNPILFQQSQNVNIEKINMTMTNF